MINNYSTLSVCNCATDIYCQNPVFFDRMEGRYMLPGLIEGCFTLESLLLSTLECFYSNSDCLSILLNKTRELFNFSTEIPWINIQPLVFNEASSRFIPKTSLSLIIQELMVEEWNPSFSFDRYYESCSPKSCIYSYTTYRESFCEIIVTFIYIIGGLTVVLRLITSQLVKCILYLFQLRLHKRQEGKYLIISIQNNISLFFFIVRQNLFDRLKLRLRNVVMFCSTKLMNVNIFCPRNFGNNINQETSKRCGRWATRLYIVLLIVIITISAFYTLIQPQILTKTFLKPSLNTYNRLIYDHGDTLTCPCLTISSSYSQFVKIESIFHQVKREVIFCFLEIDSRFVQVLLFRMNGEEI